MARCKEKARANRRRYYARNREKELARMALYRSRRPEVHSRSVRAAGLRRYGLTKADYDAMFASQSGVCAICAKADTKGNLHVDHCHVTGKVRGLLCGPCNRGLGSFRDTPENLERAALYLKRQVSGATPLGAI